MNTRGKVVAYKEHLQGISMTVLGKTTERTELASSSTPMVIASRVNSEMTNLMDSAICTLQKLINSILAAGITMSAQAMLF